MVPAMAQREPLNLALPGRIVVNQGGVYRPPLVMAEVAAFALGVLMVGATLASRPPSRAATWFGLVSRCVLAVSRIWAYRQHGPLGPPILAWREGTLVFTLPQDSRREAAVNLGEFQHLIVYGAAGRRLFRLVRADGSHVEVRPGWTVALERGAIEFVQRGLPPTLRVTVEEPQTAFASIRGDGPA
jgi:hypothetical protein